MPILLEPSASTRRCILKSAAVVAVGWPTAVLSQSVTASPTGIPRQGVLAIAFDAFVLFDPRALTRRAQAELGNKGDALVAAASSRLFSYSWLYTSAGRYEGFESLADSAFRFAAASLGIALETRVRNSLVRTYSELETWPDVPSALDQMQARGIRLALLSNMPTPVLEANLRKGKIERHFESILSTDRVRQYKPSQVAYDLAVSAFGLPRSKIGFAASAGWDAAGATWFGYRTAWVNRTHAPPEPLGVVPALVGDDIETVLALADLV